MKHLIACILAVALVVGAVSCSKQGVELKFSYPKGKAFRYRLASKINTRMATDNALSKYLIEIDMIVNAAVQRVLENGDAELLFTYEQINYLNSQNPQKTFETIKQLKDAKLYITISPYGEITACKGLEGLPKVDIEDFNLFKLLMKAHPIFPYTPIQIGKKWDRQQEFPVENGLLKGNMLVYKRFTVTDTTHTTEGNIAKISSEITMKFDLPQQDNFSIEADQDQRLGFFGNGVINFDRDHGELINARAFVVGKMVLRLKHPVTGQSIATRMETAQNIEITNLGQ